MIISNDIQIRLLKSIESNVTPYARHFRHPLIAGPSGSGKTSILNQIRSYEPYAIDNSISAVTRTPRSNEKEGRDYFFKNIKEFNQSLLLEQNPYTGNGKMYGTLYEEVVRIAVNGGKRIGFDVDLNGAKRLKEIFGDTLLFSFLQVPIDVLYKRLYSRMGITKETMEEIDRRIETAREEQKKVSEGIIVPDLIVEYGDTVSIKQAAQTILNAGHNILCV